MGRKANSPGAAGRPGQAPPRRHGPLQWLLVRLGELAFALLLVAVFFAAFLGIYNASFPQGTSLGELVRRQGSLQGVSGPRVNLEGLAPDRVPFLATLTRVDHSVKEKAANRIAWNNALAGTPLGERHAVQTFERSGATIVFDTDNRLVLGEKSLVVIRGTEKSLRTHKRTARLVVLEGELSGQVGESSEGRLVVELAGAKSTLRIDSGRGGGADFRATANPDESSTYTVYSGTAEVRAGDRTVRLAPNQTVTVDPGGRILATRRLAPAPTLVTPGDGTLLTYRALPPRVRFAWEPRSGADSYRFVLARDRELEEVVHRTDLSETEFWHGNLKPGRYFWRVTSQVGSAESRPGPLRSLELRLDREPPLLRVDFPDGVVDADRLLLAGATEPGAEVFVGEEQVAIADDGTFEHVQPLRAGANVVVVEAIDPAGNTTYQSRLVQATQGGKP